MEIRVENSNKKNNSLAGPTPTQTDEVVVREVFLLAGPTPTQTGEVVVVLVRFFVLSRTPPLQTDEVVVWEKNLSWTHSNPNRWGSSKGFFLSWTHSNPNRWGSSQGKIFFAGPPPIQTGEIVVRDFFLSWAYSNPGEVVVRKKKSLAGPTPAQTVNYWEFQRLSHWAVFICSSNFSVPLNFF